jgi:hypothetical protein
MTTGTSQEHEALRRSAELLDAIGRRSPTSTVALHSLTAAQLLSTAGIHPDAHHGPLPSDRAALDQVLTQFASVPTNLLRHADLLEALHHAMLARIAAR